MFGEIISDEYKILVAIWFLTIVCIIIKSCKRKGKNKNEPKRESTEWDSTFRWHQLQQLKFPSGDIIKREESFTIH